MTWQDPQVLGLEAWLVVRVDLTGRPLCQMSTFSAGSARADFQEQCRLLGLGVGGAVYLICDGRTVDQVVARALEVEDGVELGPPGCA